MIRKSFLILITILLSSSAFSEELKGFLRSKSSKYYVVVENPREMKGSYLLTGNVSPDSAWKNLYVSVNGAIESCGKNQKCIRQNSVSPEIYAPLENTGFKKK